jgi:hypothetical protein
VYLRELLRDYGIPVRHAVQGKILSMARNILDHQKATHVDQQIPCTIVLD